MANVKNNQEERKQSARSNHDEESHANGSQSLVVPAKEENVTKSGQKNKKIKNSKVVEYNAKNTREEQ